MTVVATSVVVLLAFDGVGLMPDLGGPVADFFGVCDLGGFFLEFFEGVPVRATRSRGGTLWPASISISA
ncbi:MAG TPA: hypothetical protein VF221_12415 [Chloroflexota bacterium]